MSYDMYMLEPRKGVDPMEQLEQMASHGPGRPLQEGEARAKRLGAALREADPRYQEVQFESGGTQAVELTSDDGIQVTLWPDHASLSVPYWDSLDAERLTADIEHVARIIAADTGWKLYDPQLEKFIDPAADVHEVRSMFRYGVTKRNEVLSERTEPRQPFWKRLLGERREGDAPTAAEERSVVEWAGYEAFHPGVSRPLNEVTRAEAKAYFDLYMTQIPLRLRALEALCAANGIAVSDDDDGLRRLNEWYIDRLDGDLETLRLDPQWYVVARDLGIWVGEYITRRAPHLEWRLFTGHKRDTAYHRPVLMGFNVENPKYNVDPEMTIIGLGAQALNGRRPDYTVRTDYTGFEQIARSALKFA